MLAESIGTSNRSRRLCELPGPLPLPAAAAAARWHSQQIVDGAPRRRSAHRFVPKVYQAVPHHGAPTASAARRLDHVRRSRYLHRFIVGEQESGFAIEHRERVELVKDLLARIARQSPAPV